VRGHLELMSEGAELVGQGLGDHMEAPGGGFLSFKCGGNSGFEPR
jgi:hypothetical protein